MPEPKKRFTPEVRNEAGRLVQASGRSRCERAADLGIGLSTLRSWIDRRHSALDYVSPAQFERRGVSQTALH